MIKGINLIPDETRRERQLRKWKNIFAALSVIYLSALAFIYLDQRAVIKEKKAQAFAVRMVRDSIAGKSDYAALARKYRDMQREESDLKKRLGVTDALADKKVSWSVILKRLTYDIPGSIWLRSLSTSDVQGADLKKIRFLGSSTTNAGIADFMFALENSGYFQDVSLSYSQKKDFGGASVYDFELYMSLKKTDEIMYEW